MGMPDFSEFSFGYAIVKQLEDSFLGRWAAPTFPTQPQEAALGYDVDFLSHGVPLFIQFKRSEVMLRRSCRECRDRSAAWRLPIYRMHLHHRDRFRQHSLMRRLERSGNIALYCTSTVNNKSDLDELYVRSSALDAARFIWPSEIRLPNRHEPHHASFNAGSRTIRVYSENGLESETRTPEFSDLLDDLRLRASDSVESERTRLNSFVSEIQAKGTDAVADEEQVAEEEDRKTEDREDQASHDQEVSEFDRVVETDRIIYSEQRRQRIARISEIESVVKRAALIAYFEMDALMVSVSRERVRE